MKQGTEALTEKQKKQHRFLLMLPVLILPFFTCLLWVLGIVGGNEAKAQGTAGGLNMQLPDAKLADHKNWNKLSFYEQADKDSAKYKAAANNDPFFQQERDSSAGFRDKGQSSFTYNPLPAGYQDVNEYRVNQKLAELNTALNSNTKEDRSGVNRSSLSKTPAIESNDVDRLAQMLEEVNQNDSGTDPETQQLNGMMDKILDIQHPERVTDRIQQESEKNSKQVFPVVLQQKDDGPTLLLENRRTKKKDVGSFRQAPGAFYSLEKDTTSEQVSNSIEAEVQETQTIISGSTLRFHLTSDIYTDGILIPKGTLIYGIAVQNADRLNITIPTIRYGNSLLPVSLSVYDLDGLEGIFIPGSISRDVAKQAGSEAVNNLGLASLDPSLGVQAANAGIAAAKSLIDKKMKQVKLTIKAGYRVLLKDKSQQ